MNNLDIYRSQPRDTKIRLYGRDAFEGMKKAGQLASRALDMLAEHVKPGVTTERLDELVLAFAHEHDAIPAPLNYRGFPKAICTSVNHVVCHGIPNAKPLKEGDIVNIDVTPILTHRFTLEEYRDAFLACGDQGKTGAVKVLFSYPS